MRLADAMPIHDIASEEAMMAKGQKRTNREIRKPKQDKPKPQPAQRSFLSPAQPRKSSGASGSKGSGG